MAVRAGTIFYVSLCSHTTCHAAILYTRLALINSHRLITPKSILSSPILIPGFRLIYPVAHWASSHRYSTNAADLKCLNLDSSSPPPFSINLLSSPHVPISVNGTSFYSAPESEIYLGSSLTPPLPALHPHIQLITKPYWFCLLGLSHSGHVTL